MADTYTSLVAALWRQDRRPILLERLKEGKILAYAPMSFGGQLIEWRVANSCEEIVSSLFRLDTERRAALRHLAGQTSHTKYVWDHASGRYFAIGQTLPSEFVAFTNEAREPEGRAEVPKSFWGRAHIDETRDTVVYDDWQDLWRKEFMRVQIDDAAVAAIDRSLAQRSVPLGRRDIYREDVAAYATHLIKENPKLKLFEFLREIERSYVTAGSRNTLNKHYGDIWRAHAVQTRMSTQKPKKTQ